MGEEKSGQSKSRFTITDFELFCFRLKCSPAGGFCIMSVEITDRYCRPTHSPAGHPPLPASRPARQAGEADRQGGRGGRSTIHSPQQTVLY